MSDFDIYAEIDDAEDHGTVKIPHGEFQGPIEISKPITLIGTGKSTTIWAKKGPVILISSLGVELQKLHIEASSRCSGSGDETDVAIKVRDGVDVEVEEVIVRGRVVGLKGEDGEWLLPTSLSLGQLAPGKLNVYKLQVHVPVDSKISSEVSNITFKPTKLKPGLNDIKMNVDDIRPNIHIQGRIWVKSDGLIRFISVTGNTEDAKGIPPVSDRLLWKPDKPPEPSSIPIPGLTPEQLDAVRLTITPEGGSVSHDPVTISMTCETENIVMRYTFDNSEPTLKWTEYEKPITVSDTTTVRARGFYDDRPVGKEVSQKYEIVPRLTKEQLDAVRLTITPEGGSVSHDPVTISMTCKTEKIVMRYTLDNSEPTLKCSEYREPITVSNNTTVRARGFYEDRPVGEEESRKYEIVRGLTPEQLDAVRLTITPEGRESHDPVTIYMTCETEKIVMRYTFDNSEPTLKWTEYEKPITVSNTTTVRASGFYKDRPVGKEVSRKYEIVPREPTKPPQEPKRDDGRVASEIFNIRNTDTVPKPPEPTIKVKDPVLPGIWDPPVPKPPEPTIQDKESGSGKTLGGAFGGAGSTPKTPASKLESEKIDTDEPAEEKKPGKSKPPRSDKRQKKKPSKPGKAFK